MSTLARLAGAVLLVGVAPPLIAAGPPKEEAARKHLERTQGTWKIVTLEADGEHAPAEIVATLKLVFQGDKLTKSKGQSAAVANHFIDGSEKAGGIGTRSDLVLNLLGQVLDLLSEAIEFVTNIVAI